MSLIFTFLVSFLISFGATPLVRALAFKIGAVDVPKDTRRVHKKPIARLGGLAIFYGFIISILVFNTGIDTGLRGLLIGSFIIVGIGVIDDIWQIKARYKLIFQIIAATVVALHGVKIQIFTNPNIWSPVEYINLGVFSIPLTILWIVGVTNAINLIDGIDGLAAGVSSIASMALFFLALFFSEINIAIITAAIAGASFGFLPYNFNPAKIFMGDTGSMFLGFTLATVSIMGLFKAYAAISFAVPLLILGLPLFDTTFAIIRRVFKGNDIMKPDRGHVHHRLMDMGFSQKQVVAILYTMSAILGLSAIVLAGGGAFRALILVFSVLIFVVAGSKYVTTMNENEEDEEDNEIENDENIEKNDEQKNN